MLTVFIPKERRPGELRVAATPETTKRYVKAGANVLLERGAGLGSNLSDEAYLQAGAQLVDGKAEDWGRADLVLKVGALLPNDALGGHEAEALREGAAVLGLLAPHQSAETLRRLAERRVTSLAMELVPRISRAQKMDALSSQASIAGYKAVLVAAASLGKYMPLLMTAAGTVQPAKVVVMGAGVAGLQAIATARRLGATVEVSDIRPAVKEQVQSLGGRFIELPMEEGGEGEGGYAKEVSADFLRRQQEVIADKVAAADIVITTALVPGKAAPRLLTRAMVERMRPGAVVVDLAVEQGGNCELSVLGKEILHGGVRIIGNEHLVSSVAEDASMLYARNVAEVVALITAGGSLDLSDEIAQAMLLTEGGELRFGRQLAQVAVNK